MLMQLYKSKGKNTSANKIWAGSGNV